MCTGEQLLLADVTSVCVGAPPLVPTYGTHSLKPQPECTIVIISHTYIHTGLYKQGVYR